MKKCPYDFGKPGSYYRSAYMYGATECLRDNTDRRNPYLSPKHAAAWDLGWDNALAIATEIKMLKDKDLQELIKDRTPINAREAHAIYTEAAYRQGAIDALKRPARTRNPFSETSETLAHHWDIGHKDAQAMLDKRSTRTVAPPMKMP